MSLDTSQGFASIIAKIAEERGLSSSMTGPGAFTHADRMLYQAHYLSRNASASETYQRLKKEPVALRTEMVRYLYSNGAPALVAGDVFAGLMRGKLDLTPDEILGWFEAINNSSEADRSGCRHFAEWPCNHMIQQIERRAKETPISEHDQDRLKAMLTWKEFNDGHYWGSDLRRVRDRIENILSMHTEQLSSVPVYLRLGGDDFGRQLERRRLLLAQDMADRWNTIFNLAGTATGSRPTKKFEKGIAELKESLGKEVLRKHLHDFLEAAVNAPITEVRKWPPKMYFSDQNTALVKGLIWMSIGLRDKKTVHLIADLCEKGMKKIPACGIASQAVANACFLYLEATPGADVAARLSRLALMIRQKTVKERIQAAIAEKAEAAGMSAAQLEERVVPEFGLSAGQKSVQFKDYTLDIVLEGPGSVTQTWLRADGTPQKAKPKVVSTDKKLKAKFDQVKKEVNDLKKTATGQRNRIDRLFAEDACWSFEDLHSYYIDHPVVGVLACKLIWDFEQDDGTFVPALFEDGCWTKANGGEIDPQNTNSVRLWHPVESDVETVLCWRRRLTEQGIVQPTKQAFREVYLLTDAERGAGTYSNRMAGHLVKQHQMSNLMATRGWTYQLMGGFDDGRDGQNAQKTFSTSPLKAEYLIHKNWAHENINDMGMMICVGTDQIRFCDEEYNPVAMDDVPIRMLSETMRDADLFVGVASIGNDPLWRDQGQLPGVREYWDSYAFGALDAFAETRKEALNAILPRLKISEQAHIDGKYLVVDGKLNTYRIHLGSSNVLISPSDQFLCIVSTGPKGLANVHLPFEGDMRLSVILSKALLLADDDKITDPVILEQLQR